MFDEQNHDVMINAHLKFFDFNFLPSKNLHNLQKVNLLHQVIIPLLLLFSHFNRFVRFANYFNSLEKYQ